MTCATRRSSWPLPSCAAPLDLAQPVAVLHFIPGADEAQSIVKQLMDELPSGSCLAVTPR